MEKLTITKWIDADRFFDGVGGVVLKRDKNLNIDFSGALDLHFTLKNYGNNPVFIIGKDNYQVYQIFDKLYNDIMNGFVFETLTSLGKDRIIFECEQNEQDYHQKLKNIYQKEEDNKEELKKRAKDLGLIVDNKIIWRSDDYPNDVAPYIEIEKGNNIYKLFFGIPKVERKLTSVEDFLGYDTKSISVRFRNSGSKYDFFNICFMRAYRSLREVCDVMEQIHIEEYLIDKKLEQGMKLERILK